MNGRGNSWMVRKPSFHVYNRTKYFLFHLAIVESVRDGTTLRVRLFMPDGEHQFVNITLAGARSPRVASKHGETSEPYGDEVSCCRSLPNAAGALILSPKPIEAKYFTESRLLQRAVKVQLLSLPTVTATPFQTNGSSTPPPASIFIGIGLAVPVGSQDFYRLCLSSLAFQFCTPRGILLSSFLGPGWRTWLNGTREC
jgi:hypothetical protein